MNPWQRARTLWLTRPTLFVVLLALAVRIAWVTIAQLGVPFQFPVERFAHVTEQGVGYMHTPIQAIDIWTRWDAMFYLWIAEHGYTHPHDPLAVAFFPLFPLTLQAAHALSGVSYVACGLWLANIFDVLGWCVLGALARRRLGAEQALWAVVAFACFPTRNFGFSIYTEGLFLLLSAAAFYAYECKKYRWAGLCSGIVSAVRPQGVLVGVALVVDALWARHKAEAQAPNRWDIAALGCAPAGLFAYMAYLWQTFGRPLGFMEVQSVWRRQLTLPLRVFWAHGEPHEHVVLLIALIMFVGLIRWRQPVRDIVYVGVSLLVPMSTGMLTSMPRFIGILFPLFFFGVLVVPKDSKRARLYWALVLIYGCVFAVKLGQGGRVI